MERDTHGRVRSPRAYEGARLNFCYAMSEENLGGDRRKPVKERVFMLSYVKPIANVAIAFLP